MFKLCLAAGLAVMLSSAAVAGDLAPKLKVYGGFERGGGVEVSVETNLPEGMDLTLAVTSPTGLRSSEGAAVKDGRVDVVLMPKTLRYVGGIYEFEISSPAGHLQPEAVQKVIGPRGENMSGQAVTVDEIFGTMIKFRTIGYLQVPEELRRHPAEHTAYQAYLFKIEHLREELIAMSDMVERLVDGVGQSPVIAGYAVGELRRFAQRCEDIKVELAQLGDQPPAVGDDVRDAVTAPRQTELYYAGILADLFIGYSEGNADVVKEKLGEKLQFFRRLDGKISTARVVMGDRPWPRMP